MPPAPSRRGQFPFPAARSGDEPGTATPSASATGTGPLVGPEWVAEHLDDPDVLLLEVDEEAATHHWAHVPGAAFLDWHDSIRPLTGPAPLATEAFLRIMSALGARPETHVVLYGDAPTSSRPAPCG